MHPALSIVAFTTLSGLGYGIAMILGLGLLDPAAITTKILHVIALALIAAGLTSSTLHLGNPQRAWRALSQWRTSWLSREGLLALATFVPLIANALSVVFLDEAILGLAIAGAVLSLATIVCTAMIYASLRTVEAWSTWLTPAGFVGLALAGGALAGLPASLASDEPRADWFAALAFIGLAAGWSARIAARRRARERISPTTPETATGLGAIGRVKLFERPHTGDNYLTREMGFRVARKHARKLWRFALVFGLGLPAATTVAALAVGSNQILAVSLALHGVVFHAIGVLVERWLFFAEARHSVMNYYGR